MTWVAAICAIFFNTFVNPIALEEIAWKYYIVFIVVLMCFGLTAYFFYPETNGYSLEQMAVIFDGPTYQGDKTAEIMDDKRGGSSSMHQEVV